MLTQVEVLTPRVTTSPLLSDPLGTEYTDPIQIRNIDGLGPVTATVNTTQYGSQDDAAYTGATTGPRNIVMSVGLNPRWKNETIESLRQILYMYFMPKNKVTLRFASTHMATVAIDGIVESCTPAIFDNDPAMQISILCPKSAFIAVSSTIVTGLTVALPDDDPTIIEYQGTLPTGFVLDITPNGQSDMAAGELRILNENPDESIYIVTADVTAANTFEMCTVTGSKYVRKILTATGTGTSILGKQAPGSIWVQLAEGTNNFRVASDRAGQLWKLEYYARYGGI